MFAPNRRSATASQHRSQQSRYWQCQGVGAGLEYTRCNPIWASRAVHFYFLQNSSFILRPSSVVAHPASVVVQGSLIVVRGSSFVGKSHETPLGCRCCALGCKSTFGSAATRLGCFARPQLFPGDFGCHSWFGKIPRLFEEVPDNRSIFECSGRLSA